MLPRVKAVAPAPMDAVVAPSILIAATEPAMPTSLATSSSEAQIRQTMAQLGAYTTELANVKKKLAEAS